MSLGPIRELSAGPKPGRVSTFTKRLRGEAKEARRKEGEVEPGIRKDGKRKIKCIYILGLMPNLMSGTEQ